MQGKRVLELGCGHGMPGILAMLAGAEVHFQVWQLCSISAFIYIYACAVVGVFLAVRSCAVRRFCTVLYWVVQYASHTYAT